MLDELGQFNFPNLETKVGIHSLRARKPSYQPPETTRLKTLFWSRPRDLSSRRKTSGYLKGESEPPQPNQIIEIIRGLTSTKQ